MTTHTPPPLPPGPRAGAQYRAYKELLWAEVRRRYLAGETGPALCREYGLAQSTFSTRAKAEGWRRKDHPQEPAPADPADAAQALMNRAVLAAAAGQTAQANTLANASKTFRIEAQKGKAEGFGPDQECPHCGKRLGEPVDPDAHEKSFIALWTKIFKRRIVTRRDNIALKESDPAAAAAARARDGDSAGARYLWGEIERDPFIGEDEDCDVFEQAYSQALYELDGDEGFWSPDWRPDPNRQFVE